VRCVSAVFTLNPLVDGLQRIKFPRMLATAVVMIFWMAGGLPTGLTGDPLRDLTRAVVTEHARTLSWSDAQPDVVPATLPRVMDESGVVLNLVFTGDSDIRLINAHPTYVEGHRGLSLAYQDARGHGVTYVIFPGAVTVALPESERVKTCLWMSMWTWLSSEVPETVTSPRGLSMVTEALAGRAWTRV